MIRRSLRSLGILLIVLPEPFTTPFGIALLCASLCLPGKERVDTYSHLQNFFTAYLKQIRSYDLSAYDEYKALEKVVHHTIRRGLPYEFKEPEPEKIIHHVLRRDLPYEYKAPEPEKLIHHPLKRDLLFKYGEQEPEKVIHHALRRDLPYEPKASEPEKIVHHTLKRDLLYKYEQQEPEKVIHHTLNMVKAMKVFASSGHSLALN